MERTEHFDRDPGWEGRYNRPSPSIAREIRQAFGWSSGSIGGFITPAAEPAYYAKPIPRKTFDDPLTASGVLRLPGRKTHALIGFFNSKTVNEWRTANSIFLRVQGRGDHFFAYVEYATSKWRAGGDSPGGFSTIKDPQSGRSQLKGFPRDGVYPWSMTYEPLGNNGAGSITVKFGDETAVCNLSPGHKADGATFDRFGVLNVVKSADDGGEMAISDIAINGDHEHLSKNPNWDGQGNRRTYKTLDIRPHGDFGFSDTSYAGDKPGELGGLIFRGDCRYPGSMACYGDRLSELSLAKPLHAGGKIVLRRGVSDSDVLIGFYNAADSMEVNPSQSSAIPRSFLGIACEGPSREGFLIYPVYRTKSDQQGYVHDDDRPHIMPDGRPHTWDMRYESAKMTVSLDGATVSLGVRPDEVTRFNRFGIITTWIDGNGQRLYLDDLTYTVRQD